MSMLWRNHAKHNLMNILNLKLDNFFYRYLLRNNEK